MSEYKINVKELWYIIYRNVFLYYNAVIFVVAGLLIATKAIQAGIFLALVMVINIILGLVQDIHAWIALAKLQLLTAPRVIRVENGIETSVLTEQIRKNELIKLKIGDQVPCDGTLVDSRSFEINEGLITGESNSLVKHTNDKISAGSVVTSGSGLLRIETLFKESRIARMTEGVKKYSVSTSPIQDSINKIIVISGYTLILVLAYAITRGLIVHEPIVRLIKNIGALTSEIVPQGLVFTATLFFAYGAAHLFRRHVLLQEVNATEKLGRIDNLCMDKTGTLTDNILVVEHMFAPQTVERKDALRYVSAYIQGTEDSSQIIVAIRKFLGHISETKIIDALTFSSWRQYGAVLIKDVDTARQETISIYVGQPEVFLPHLSNEERPWLENLLETHSRMGKHIVCVAQSRDTTLPQTLSGTSLSVTAVFVFFNNLREGIRDTVDFFQKRGVRIRIISGDSVDTTRTVAALAGINFSDQCISGKEMENWSQVDYEKKVNSYSIFGKIVPEQKEKIVSAFKKNGFTAMIGDGANDALAIKKADLGIAMFDGAPAIRQIAAVVLTNNSFSALPGGVELADSVIQNLEIFASLFMSQTMLGFLLFVLVSALGHEYPITPLNITLINYFTIGIPGLLISYWAISPTGRVYARGKVSFLKRILPFSIGSAVIQGIGAIGVFFISSPYVSPESNIAVIFTFVISGFIFLVCTPGVYHGTITRVEKLQLVLLGIFELLFMILIFRIPFLIQFFDITPDVHNIPQTVCVEILVIIALVGLAQYICARWLGKKIERSKQGILRRD